MRLMLKFTGLLLLAWLLVPALAAGQTREERAGDGVQAPGAESTSNAQPPDLAVVPTMIISRTNVFRQAEDRAPLAINLDLTATAQDFANFMARTDRYGHTADGNHPAERATEHGYAYCIVAENIAYQYNSAGFTTEGLVQGFVRGWQRSPGHRENMLDPNVTETGVAVAQSEQSGYIYAVQMFGRPQSAQFEFQITNMAETVIRYQLGDEEFRLPPRYTRTHQRCTPTQLTWQWPNQQVASTLQSGDEDHYTVVQAASGEFQVRKSGM